MANYHFDTNSKDNKLNREMMHENICHKRIRGRVRQDRVY